MPLTEIHCGQTHLEIISNRCLTNEKEKCYSYANRIYKMPIKVIYLYFDAIRGYEIEDTKTFHFILILLLARLEIFNRARRRAKCVQIESAKT